MYLLSFGFEKPFFLSFKQAQELGGHIKAGAKSIQVVFWKMREHNKADGTVDKIPMLRYYKVFHIDSVEGIDLSKIPQLQSHDREFNSIQACENIMDNWLDKPEIEIGKSHACYIPSRDVIQMPDPRTFFSDSGYFSVLFHESCHCTGHCKRLNRDMSGHFADHSYSIEELIAEMGAAYLCALCNIQNDTIKNSAAYIQSWLSKFKSDNKILVMAASKAQHAVDYITQTQFETVETVTVQSEHETVSVHSF